MRRFYLACSLAILIAALTVYGVSAAPPSITLVEARNKVDSWLANRWPLIQQRESEYFAANGRYWQGLRSNVSDLVYTDTTDVNQLADNLGSSPTDQPATWLAIFPELQNVNIPAVIWVDVYAGPQGAGYVASVMICHNATCYTRSQNVGPESWRTQAWSVIQVGAE